MPRVHESTSHGQKENCRIPKPLIEKKRRARMNKSVREMEKLLADLISLESKNRKNGKLEKADILEIAVRRMKQQDAKGKDARLFQQGYRRCLSEVTLFLENNISSGSDHLVSNLSDYVLQQSGSLCSVIRHTGQIKEQEVTSTVETRCVSSTDDATISSSSCDSSFTHSSVWRPWGQQIN